MPSAVVLLRSERGKHLQFGDPDLHDPDLTNDAKVLCRAMNHLHRRLKTVTDKAELIVVSPMQRSIQTALLTLSRLVDKNIPIIARAEWQENTNSPCDTGTDVTLLAKKYPKVDFSQVDPIFPSKTGRYAYTHAASLQRGADAISWLADRPEKVIVVVSHTEFLRTSVLLHKAAVTEYQMLALQESQSRLWIDPVGGGAKRRPRGEFLMEEDDFPPEATIKGKGKAVQQDVVQQGVSSLYDSTPLDPDWAPPAVGKTFGEVKSESKSPMSHTMFEEPHHSVYEDEANEELADDEVNETLAEQEPEETVPDKGKRVEIGKKADKGKGKKSLKGLILKPWKK